MLLKQMSANTKAQMKQIKLLCDSPVIVKLLYFFYLNCIRRKFSCFDSKTQFVIKGRKFVRMNSNEAPHEQVGPSRTRKHFKRLRDILPSWHERRDMTAMFLRIYIKYNRRQITLSYRHKFEQQNRPRCTPDC